MIARTWGEILTPNLRTCHSAAATLAYLWDVHEAASAMGLACLDREALRLRGEAIDAAAARVGELVRTSAITPTAG